MNLKEFQPEQYDMVANWWDAHHWHAVPKEFLSKTGLLIEDEGKGIEDIDMALMDEFSTATTEMREMGFGAGMGLPNIRRNSDLFSISSTVGTGTRLSITINPKVEEHS